MRFAALAVSVCAASLAACGVLPKDGPVGLTIPGNANTTVEPSSTPMEYAFVALSPLSLKNANLALRTEAPGFGSFARAGRETEARIAVGDILQVTVFEATAGGLFIPSEAGSRAGNFITVPNQQVDSSGSISPPYAGRLEVVGKTPQQVQKAIAERLAKRAIEPQVVVSFVERRSNEVAVLGDVNLPQRFALDPGGIRALDAIARAGGPKSAPYESVVTVQRRGVTEQAPMTTILRSPSQNIQLRGGDVVYVSKEPRIFMTLGATLPPGSVGGINNRRFPFDNDNMTLAEAVARSGGLDDNRADARSVFLYRFERRATLEAMGVDTSRYHAERVPTIYNVNLNRSDGLFLANSFYMKNGDVIYVANAFTPDLNKLLVSLQILTASAYNSSISANLARQSLSAGTASVGGAATGQ